MPAGSHGCSEYDRLTRRQFLGGVSTLGAAGFLGLIHPELLFASPGPKATAESVIVLWMRGGQSHLDTWDPKPGTKTGGPFESIETAVKDIKISQHLPLIAKEFNDISLIRSLTSKEGSHERATYLMRTGYAPLGSFQHSSLGSVLTKMKGRNNDDLPPYVTIGGPTWPAGYLGAAYAPFHIATPNDATRNIDYHRSVNSGRFNRRLKMLRRLDRSFHRQHRGKEVVEAYAAHYQAAYDMMRSKTVSAFDLEKEKQAIRERYGVTFFGQGCMLARRLVDVGIRFVEVTLPGWDTHTENFETVEKLSSEMDQAVSVLIADLRQREKLHKTLILLCGEFGRTPSINGNNGRDHWPRVWSAMIAGGGITGGRVIGQSTPGGEEVAENPCSVGSLHATICKCLDLNTTEYNYAADGRPIRVVKDANAKPIADLFT